MKKLVSLANFLVLLSVGAMGAPGESFQSSVKNRAPSSRMPSIRSHSAQLNRKAGCESSSRFRLPV